jgi:Pilus formation protein N terminal region
MSAVFARRRRPFAVLAAALFAAAALGATPTQADTVNVNIDEARVMRLPDRVVTIVIGNPLIADASLQTGGVLVLTGKGYGSTNMLALDRAGKVVMDNNVVVLSPSAGGRDLVVVYKGIERESYSCSPDCAPRTMLGDSAAYFSANMNQSGQRSGGAAAPAAK